ncbi:MAG: FKBP-type peptidyl-prolyl cis-trans isomerase [Rikenellaceae bacterium]
MRKFFLNAIIASLVGVSMFGSCVKQAEDNSEELQLESLRAWISANRPDMEEYEEGLFMKVHKVTSSSSTLTFADDDWVEVTYSAQTLDGNYYYNMYSAMADTLGTFTYYTHFVPDRVSYYYSAYYLSQAQIYALQNMGLMDSVEIIALSKYVYSGTAAEGTSIPTGYEGNSYLSSYAPAHIKMRFNSRISDMVEYERMEVLLYATEELGLAVDDSIADYSMLYMKKLVECPDADTISTDTTVNVWYTGKFTDGFVFDTNVAAVAKDHNIYVEPTDDSDSYVPLSFTYGSSDDDTYITGFREMIYNMRLGEKAIGIMSSNLAYGEDGSTSGNTLIRPNEPLVFIIEVTDETEDDEDE